MPPRNLVREIIVGLVLLDRSTESGTGLNAGVSGIRNRAERVHRLKIPVTQVAVDVAVEIIRSRARDDVDHPARGAAIFGAVTIGDDLEFLHRLLRNGGAHAVGGVVGGVGAIDIHQVRARALAAHV